MVDAEPSTEIPIAEANLILRVGRWLDIPTVVQKLKLLLRPGIELRRISDGVLQTFMDRVEYCVRAHFPVVVPVVSSKVRPDIAFAIPAVLQNNDGSRKRIRRERRSGVSNTPGNRSEEHTSELQSRLHLVCRLLLEKKKKTQRNDQPLTYNRNTNTITPPAESKVTTSMLTHGSRICLKHLLPSLSIDQHCTLP